MTACGGGVKIFYTPTGTSQITVTAATPMAGTSHNTMLTLTVTP